jgi:site-specific DNA-methyltransferase (adenine-specific)
MPETFHAGPNLGRLSDVTIIHGDCIEAMRELADDSVDAIVCDPPYGLEFMGKEWDSFKQTPNAWATRDKSEDLTGKSSSPFLAAAVNKFAAGLLFQQWCTMWTTEALRVLKPGGHLLAFGGTRTWHRLAVAVEDAGFEIRDSIAWLYGSGFPKSLDVSKAIDKAAGATREVVGARAYTSPKMDAGQGVSGLRVTGGFAGEYEGERVAVPITAPATPEAEQWQGWGTALKPAFEPVVVGRKPFKGNVAANVLAHGTGAINIDACRIGTTDNLGGGVYSGEFRRTGALNIDATRIGNGDGIASAGGTRRSGGIMGESTPLGGWEPTPGQGRWPANVVLDESQAAALDEQSGYQKDGTHVGRNRNGAEVSNEIYGARLKDTRDVGYGAGGGASRFFKVAPIDELDARFKYCAKAPKKERPVVVDADGKSHSHPTTKPLTLMRWLVRLVTPPGGVVLDPFAGSGTTVEAALLEDFRVIGIERGGPEGTDAYHYLGMIQQRIARCLNC